jgi:hypothetical protein
MDEQTSAARRFLSYPYDLFLKVRLASSDHRFGDTFMLFS